VANDANLAALGELAGGWGKSFRTFVYLLVGTGLGMGLVVDGRLHVGARGAAGEVAYLPFGDEASSRPPVYGARWGSFEEMAAARGVVRSAVDLGLSSRLSALQVFDMARRGSPAARAAVVTEAERLALVVAAVTTVLDPEAVVMGGGVGGELDLLREPMEARLQQLTPFRPRIVVSELGDEAVLLGALSSAIEVVRDQAPQRRSAVSAVRHTGRQLRPDHGFPALGGVRASLTDDAVTADGGGAEVRTDTFAGDRDGQA
jgi:predicted NBD/HSP70 family sugar kinase